MLKPDTGASGQHQFMSSGDVAWFKELGTRLLGPELTNVNIWNRKTDET